jgi:hypothetical protein
MIKETLHVNNYTDKEIESCWFSSHEYNTIKKGLFMTLDFMKLLPPPSSSSRTTTTNLFCNNNNNNNNNKSKINDTSSSYCMRGLEDLSSSLEGGGEGTKKSTLILRQNAIVAVLDEQDRQVENVYHFHIQQLQLLQQHHHQQQQHQQQHHEQQQQQHYEQHDHHGQQEQLQDIIQLLNHNNPMILCYDDIKIRNIYRKYTRISEDNAYSRALIDEAEIVRVQRQQQLQQQHDHNNNDDDNVRSYENPLFSTTEKRRNFNTAAAAAAAAIGRGVLHPQSCTAANTASQQQHQQHQQHQHQPLVPHNLIILQ